MTILNIPEDSFNEIVSVLGVPFVQEEELELGFYDIKSKLILPALKEYFRWFPLHSEVSVYQVGSNFTIDFPDDIEENTFGVIDARFNTARQSGGYTGNAFIDSLSIRPVGARDRGVYGTRFDYGNSAALTMQRFENQSKVESTKATKITVDEQNRRIVGFSNIMSTLEVTWAKWSSDWVKVPFSDEGDLIRLCQGRILKHFGTLRQMQNTPENMPSSLNGDVLVEQGKELVDEVLEKWKMRSKIVLLRG